MTQDASKSCTLRIFRYDAADDAPPRFDAFTVETRPGMTVLDALFQVQQEQDPTLAFRYSCRGAVCGSCGMVVNGRLDLACRVQLAALGADEIVLEPLPNLEVLRDLAVDMTPFWDAYERVRPWLHEKTAGQARMSPKERGRIDQYVNCILCACCYAACPVAGRGEGYLGPAALAKLARFVEDVRDGRPPERLDAVDSALAAWGCHMIFRCRDACPKEVRPSDGVAAVRRRLLKNKLARRRGTELENE